jgi:hypothetical protein
MDYMDPEFGTTRALAGHSKFSGRKTHNSQEMSETR